MYRFLHELLWPFSDLLDVEPHRAGLTAHRPPKLPCPSCGGEMEFDEFPNRYLSFLA